MDHTIPDMPCQGFSSAQNAQNPCNSRCWKNVPQVDRKRRMNTKYRPKFLSKLIRKMAWLRPTFIKFIYGPKI